jgi:hypothetical protein
MARKFESEYPSSQGLERKRVTNPADGYKYYLKHGVGPGTLPRDVKVLDQKDLPNYMTIVWLDRPLSSEELDYYDVPSETRNREFAQRYGEEREYATNMRKSGTVKYANADYTGGGFYFYNGELGNGDYFIAADDWNGYEPDDCSIIIMDVDPERAMDEYDDFWTVEWIDTHTVKEITGNKAVAIWNSMLQWIIDNQPDGNYSTRELKQRFR